MNGNQAQTEPLTHDTAPKLVTQLGNVKVVTQGGPTDACADDIAERHREQLAAAVKQASSVDGEPVGYS